MESRKSRPPYDQINDEIEETSGASDITLTNTSGYDSKAKPSKRKEPPKSTEQLR